MKTTIKTITFSLLLATASFATNAASLTDLNAKWTCTTNASSSDNADEKAADDHMKNTKGAAADSFAFAAKNCRDCTKITCEAEE